MFKNYVNADAALQNRPVKLVAVGVRGITASRDGIRGFVLRGNSDLFWRYHFTCHCKYRNISLYLVGNANWTRPDLTRAD